VSSTVAGPTVNVAAIQEGQILLSRPEDLETWALPGGGAEDLDELRGRSESSRKDFSLKIFEDRASKETLEGKGLWNELEQIGRSSA